MNSDPLAAPKQEFASSFRAINYVCYISKILSATLDIYTFKSLKTIFRLLIIVLDWFLSHILTYNKLKK